MPRRRCSPCGPTRAYPRRGTVAVCDFGGSGTSITLMDAAGDYQPLAPTVRHHDFSGDLIDQALLTAVMANMPSTGSFDPSGTVGDRLAEPAADRLPKRQGAALVEHGDHADRRAAGMRGEIRLTRNELDDAIRASLNNFVAVLDKRLARNGIRDLVAVVSVGGGANIPAVTTTLSRTLPRPGRHDAAPATDGGHRRRAAGGARSRRDRGNGVGARRARHGHGAGPGGAGRCRPRASCPYWRGRRPATNRGSPPRAPTNKRGRASEKRKRRLFRLPVLAAIVGTAVAVLLVGTAVMIGLNSANKSATTPAPGVTSSPVPDAARQHRDRPAAGTHRTRLRAVDHGYQPARQHRDAVYQRPVSQTAAGAAPRGRARTSGDPAGSRSTAHSAGTRSQRTHPGARPGQ